MEMRYGGVNLHNVELIISAGFESQLIKGGIPQVAFSGRSNVGKSSLINSLLGRKKLARVSASPGKTVTANYYELDKQMFLVDLPGYGFARRSKEEKKSWGKLMEDYFTENPCISLVVQLADIKIGLTVDDREMLGFMSFYKIPYVIAATKCDKLNKTELNKKAAEILTDKFLRRGTEIILYSSESNLGRDELWKRIITSSLGG